MHGAMIGKCQRRLPQSLGALDQLFDATETVESENSEWTWRWTKSSGMAGCGWQGAGGRWQVAGGRWEVIPCNMRIAGYRSHNER